MSWAAIALLIVCPTGAAEKVARRLGSETLPWVVYGVAVIGALVACASLVEIGLRFRATDAGSPGSAALVSTMIATGFIGVSTVIALVGLLAVIAVKLATAQRPVRIG